MHTVDLYRKVRVACRDGMSERAAARHFGISRESVRKMLRFSVPPGYRRTAPIRRPKLDGFTDLIDRWLIEDRTRPRKQRHTAKRAFDRLRNEYGFRGSYTIVKDYVREHRRRCGFRSNPITDSGVKPITFSRRPESFRASGLKERAARDNSSS